MDNDLAVAVARLEESVKSLAASVEELKERIEPALAQAAIWRGLSILLAVGASAAAVAELFFHRV